MIVDHGHMHGVEYRSGWILFVCSRCSRQAWLRLEDGAIRVENVGEPLALHLMRADKEHLSEQVYKEVSHEYEL
jgi:hypothetical protein